MIIVKKTNKSKNKNLQIILKSGATDLRRQEKTLIELINNNYPDEIKPNVIYGFSNTNGNAIKLLKMNPEKSIKLLKIKGEGKYPWPEYQEKGKEGYTVSLSGKDKKKFLDLIGCPENL